MEVDVLVAGSQTHEEVVVADVTAARPEARITEARILNYLLSVQVGGLVG